MEKKYLLLVLLMTSVCIRSVQSRTKLQQALKGVLNFHKLESACKCQSFLIFFCHEDPTPKDLISCVLFINFSVICNESYHGESRTLHYKIWEAYRSFTPNWKECQTIK